VLQQQNRQHYSDTEFAVLQQQNRQHYSDTEFAVLQQQNRQHYSDTAFTTNPAPPILSAAYSRTQNVLHKKHFCLKFIIIVVKSVVLSYSSIC